MHILLVVEFAKAQEQIQREISEKYPAAQFTTFANTYDYLASKGAPQMARRFSFAIISAFEEGDDLATPGVELAQEVMHENPRLPILGISFSPQATKAFHDLRIESVFSAPYAEATAFNYGAWVEARDCSRVTTHPARKANQFVSPSTGSGPGI